MDNMLKTPPKVPIHKQTAQPECKTPTPIQQTDQNYQSSSNDELRKAVTPDRLRVPKAFKYPERYTSPTDLMMSPITKGLLARSKKGSVPLPPGINQPKIPDMCLQDVGPFQNKLPIKIDEKLNSS
ncbi:hypothetical protein RIF29_19214 [Crotalaria pallida]|uniref:Uncharacterized protein n=1 Tax=Crotalaria pallida TaxID=3830 RepID=A0AAN9F1K9_CROPI